MSGSVIRSSGVSVRRQRRQMVGDGPQDDGRHERESTDQEHRSQEHRREREIVGQQRSRRLRGSLLLGEEAGDGDR